jgi:hypothetical protein
MTRKDYQLIADAIGLALATERKSKDKDAFSKEQGVHFLTGVLSAKLQIENPRFNLDKFNKAIEEKAKNAFTY